MGFFDKLFGVNTTVEKQPDIKFGRFSDHYKSKAQRDAWDKSVKAFEDKQYLESMDLLCQYLKDENTTNIQWSIEEGILNAKMYQGSKKVFITTNEDMLRVFAKVARTDALNIGFMRRMMEQNYVMKYARYGLDDDGDLSMVYDSPLSEASPSKMYYAIKELAVNVDKQDDLLIDEFEDLHFINDIHISPIADDIKKIKLDYLRKTITDAFAMVNSDAVDIVKDHGAPSFLLLSTIYKLDYLVHPEGFITQKFEEIHQLYFENTGQSNIQKNESIIELLQEVLDRTDEELAVEIYDVDSTFGITKAATHDILTTAIIAELPRIEHYYKDGHFEYAQAIPNFVLGFSQFNYSLPKPDLEFIHLYWQIMEAPYFKSLGFSLHYHENDAFDQEKIKAKISEIHGRYSSEFTLSKIDDSVLDFTDMTQFAKSYLTMISKLEIKPLVK